MSLTPEDEMLLRQRLGVAAADDNYLANQAAIPQQGIAPPQTPGIVGIDQFSGKLADAGASARRILGRQEFATNPYTHALALSAPAMAVPGEVGMIGRTALGSQRAEHGGANIAARVGANAGMAVDAHGPDPVPQAISPVPTLDPRYGQIRQVGAQGVGGGVNPLAASRDRYLSAESNLVGDLDTEKDLTLQKGEQQVDRVNQVAMGEHIMAARQERDAQIQAHEDAKAAERHEAFLARNQQLADEIGQQKIDPHRLFKNQSGGQQFLFLLGSTLGGALAGITGGRNDFMDRAERMVDRDIAAQQAAIDSKKASLSARQSVFGQMLSEHGDRRLAALQTKQMMYKSAELHLKAKEAEATTPEMATNAKIAANAFQIKQDELTTAIAQRSYQQQQAQAAAAAAAQSAAADKAWSRSMDVAKLGLEGDKLKVEIAKLEAAGRKEEAEQLRGLSKELADPATVQGRVSVEASYNRLKNEKGEIDPNKGLPGVGAKADLQETLFAKPKGIQAINPAAHVLNKAFGLSKDERVSRQDWNQLKLGYRHMVTGAGGGQKELADIEQTFQGANTPQEQANAVKKLYDTVNRLEETKRAGFDPAVVRKFDEKVKGSSGAPMPQTVVVKR